MKTYQERKAAAREEAIQWQQDFENNNYSWLELAVWCEHFKKLAKRYGLMEEFTENGII